MGIYLNCIHKSYRQGVLGNGGIFAYYYYSIKAMFLSYVFKLCC